MSFVRNLQILPATQIYYLVSVSQKTAVLKLFETIETDKPSEQDFNVVAGRQVGEVAFRDGKAVYANLENIVHSLPDILVEARLLTDVEAQNLAHGTVHAGMSERALATHLIDGNYVTAENLKQAVQTHIERCLLELLTWENEAIELNDGMSPPDSVVLFPVDLEQFATVQLQNEEDVPLFFTNALKLTDLSGKDTQLTDEEREFIRNIDPRYIMWRTIKVCNLSNHEAMSIAKRLIDAGIVKLVKPEGKSS